MMKQTGTLKTLGFQIVILWLIVGCAAQTMVTEEPAAAEPAVSATRTAEAPQPVPNGPGCAAPRPEDAARCWEMEAEILAATLRLDLRIYAPDKNGNYAYEDGSVGLATIVAGRYLLTHNHFGLSLEDFQDEQRRTLTLYRPDGEVVLKDAPFGSFDVLAAAPQTLVFDFGDYGGEGLFTVLNLQSATVDSQQAQLRPGMEVAQVDWDGRTAHVDWVRIKSIREENGTHMLVLDNFVAQGASGGGIFYEGAHLANNWFRRTEESASGDVVRQYTVAAMNQGTDLMTAEAVDLASAG